MKKSCNGNFTFTVIADSDSDPDDMSVEIKEKNFEWDDDGDIIKETWYFIELGDGYGKLISWPNLDKSNNPDITPLILLGSVLFWEYSPVINE